MIDKVFVDTMSEVLKSDRVLVIGDSILDVWINMMIPKGSPEGGMKFDGLNYHIEGGGCANIHSIIRDLNNKSFLMTNGELQNSNYAGILPKSEFVHLVETMKKNVNIFCVDVPFSMKTRYACSDSGVMFRYDKDFKETFNWEYSISSIGFTNFMGMSRPKNIVIQDYGKGLVNRTLIERLEKFNPVKYRYYTICKQGLSTYQQGNRKTRRIYVTISDI